EFAGPVVRCRARFHANEARWQVGKKLEYLRSTNTPPNHHLAIRIDAVNLKHRLRNIETDRANLPHGRLPSMWFASTQPPYGTSMPQSGRRPPHHSRRFGGLRRMSACPQLRPRSGHRRSAAMGQQATSLFRAPQEMEYAISLSRPHRIARPEGLK